MCSLDIGGPLARKQTRAPRCLVKGEGAQGHRDAGSQAASESHGWLRKVARGGRHPETAGLILYFTSGATEAWGEGR